MTNNTLTCLSCNSKPCKKTKDNTFEICQYGISFLNKNGKIEVREPKVPLSTIAKNLRHEINPILQTIIEEVSKLDPTLSVKKINLSKPLSKIVGSALILDNFIQMITGVHEFHSTPSISSKKVNLYNLVTNYYTIYSIIKEESRTKNLTINNLIPKDIFVIENSDYLTYMVCILIDNAWKYSIDNSTLTVNFIRIKNKYCEIKFSNTSKVIPSNIDIFDMGVKAEKDSKGFGYGLNWIKDLEVNYNDRADKKNHPFKISHNQLTLKNEYSLQEFTLENLKILYEK